MKASTKIPKSKKKAWSLDGTVIKSVTVELTDLEIQPDAQQRVQGHLKQLQFYLKSIESLEECNETLQTLYRDFYDHDGEPISGKCRTTSIALQSHALTCYRACFIGGEKNKRPLEPILNKFKENPFHTQVRKIADKLHAHFDKNSNISSLTLCWDFEHLDDDRYTPQRVNRISHRVDLINYTTLNIWVELNYKFIKLVREEVQVLSKRINEILGESTLVD